MSATRIQRQRQPGSLHRIADLAATGALPTDVVQGATGRIEVLAMFVAALAIYAAGLKVWAFAEDPSNIVPLQVTQLVAMLAILGASGVVAVVALRPLTDPGYC